MPDLNLRNPLVAKYLTQNAIWWIEYANLDGFRVDTYNYSDQTAMANWAKSITNEYPNFNIVGEIWMHNQANLAYWQKDSKIGAIENYNSNLPSVMDFTLQSQITSAFNEDEPTWDNGLIKFYNNFAMDYLYPNTNNILVFAENHDTDRMNDKFKYDFPKYKLAMTLLATVRGIPQLYYGSEIGMGGDKGKGAMQTFVRIFLVDGLAIKTMRLPQQEEHLNKQNISILLQNYSTGENRMKRFISEK